MFVRARSRAGSIRDVWDYNEIYCDCDLYVDVDSGILSMRDRFDIVVLGYRATSD